MNRTRYILFTIGILGVAVIAYFVVNSDPSYPWDESYKETKAVPYGSALFEEMVKTRFNQSSFTTIEDSLHLALNETGDTQGNNYFFIGSEIYLDSLELSSLLNWTRSGNRCFLISNTFQPRLLDTLLRFPMEMDDIAYYDEYIDLAPTMRRYVEDTVYLDLYSKPAAFDSTVEVVYVRDKYPIVHAWPHFPNAMITRDGSTVQALGNFDVDHTNFIRFPYGEGEIYLHSTPIVFSNYNLLSQQRFDYAGKCLAHISDGDILWDGYNREYQWTAPSRGGTQYEHNEGPLAFILSQRGLRMAWTLLIALGLLYMIFGAKRKQRPIPVVHAPTNTSLEYAETIGTMFRAQNNHLQLSRLKMDLFLSWVRERYMIRTLTENETEKKQLISQLAVKSDVPKEQVQDIFDTFEQLIKLQDPEGRRMIFFHQKLEAFYQKAR